MSLVDDSAYLVDIELRLGGCMDKARSSVREN
jgi:hypothetical protein